MKSLFPRSTFLRRYVLIMSVLTTAALLATMSLLAVRPAESVRVDPIAPVASEGLPVLGQIEDFALTDQTGASFSSSALNGTVYVADFIFTSCAGICPTMSGAMAQLHRAFASAGSVEFVSISVDPATDTPEVLAAYGERYGADPATWHFLTGPDETIQGIGYEQFQLGSGDDPLIHSNKFVLVDGLGRIRGYYDGTDPASVERLGTDLAELLNSSIR